jgi:uncharacterized membrane protein YbhN (UPF0104 family)
MEGILIDSNDRPTGQRLRALWRGHPTAITVVGSLLVIGALGWALADDRHEFAAALGAAPLWLLGVAVLLHVGWLAARSEAWSVCVKAAGGAVDRRRLYRASSVGYLGNLFNGAFGLAVRTAALRRSAPNDSPPASVLIAAEIPIAVVEGALAALMSFTLVGPLGLPWWSPLVAFTVIAGLIVILQRVARDRRAGIWAGLAILRGLDGRARIVALVILAVVIQIARNWFLLNGAGVEASVLDSIAVLIGFAVFGLLPVGPGGAAAAVALILGAGGIAAAAAAGAMLTATAAVGALCFAAWALFDLLRSTRSPKPAY